MTPESQHFDRKSLRKVVWLISCGPAFYGFLSKIR